MRRGLVVLAAATVAVSAGALVLRSGAPAELPSADAVINESISYFEARLAGNPGNTLVAGQLINRYLLRFGRDARLLDLEKAETLARDAVPLARDRSGALARLSGVLLMQHKFEPAFQAAEEAARLAPYSAETRGVWLEASLAIGRYDVADSLAPTLDESSVSNLVHRAQWLDATGRTETARALLGRACEELRRSNDEPMVLAWCLTQLAGMSHAVAGPEAARREYQRALAVSPGYRGAAEGLAALALAEGNAAAAVEGYERILSDAHPDMYLRLAEGYRTVGRPERAADAEARFLAIAGRPEFEPLYGNVLAMFYLERGQPGDLDLALAIARREVDRRPTMESWDLLGWVHLHRGDIVEAVAASARSRTWGAGSPMMAFHHSRILRAAGRSDAAASLEREARDHRTLLSPAARRALDASAAS